MMGMTRLPAISRVFQMRRLGAECWTTQLGRLRPVPTADTQRSNTSPSVDAVSTRSAHRSSSAGLAALIVT